MDDKTYEITFSKDGISLSHKDVTTPIKHNNNIKTITNTLKYKYDEYKKKNNTDKAESTKAIFVFLTETVKNCIIQKYTNIEGKIKEGTKRDSVNNWETILGHMLSKIHSDIGELKIYISNSAFNYFIDSDGEITGGIILEIKINDIICYKFIILFDKHLRFTVRLVN